nr:hypothetical protein KRX_4316 [Escherichia coli KRX]
MPLIFVDVNGPSDVEVVRSFDVSTYLPLMPFSARALDFMITKSAHFSAATYCGSFSTFPAHAVIVKTVAAANNLPGFIFIPYWVY